MAIIEARVVNVTADSVTVSASREGGCQSCSQNEHCAIIWQHERGEKLVKLSTADKPIALGDAINLQCDERVLLLYISLLFLPTLIFLLLSTLLSELVFSDFMITSQTLISCSVAFILGASLSRYLLGKFNHKLRPAKLDTSLQDKRTLTVSR